MIEAIHQSALNMSLRCGEQFRRRYIENEIIPPSIAAARGTSLHKASQVNLKQKIRTQEDLPLSDLYDAARDGYVHALANGVYIPKDELHEKDKLLNEGLEDALRCASLYHTAVAPKIMPTGVEEPFFVDVGLALPLAGTIDYVAVQHELGDLKTTSNKWPVGRAQQEIQPIFYSFVYEKERGTRPSWKYQILIARRGKNGPTHEELQVEEIYPTDQSYAALWAKLNVSIEMLQKGVFPPASPTSWWCSPKWCGYWYTCPYVGNQLPKKWI